jgi:actin-related protein 3
MRERGEMVNVPPEDQLKVAGKVKEDYSYVCQDIVREFRKYDEDPLKHFMRYDGEHSVTGRVSFTFCAYLSWAMDNNLCDRNMASI